MENCLLCLEHKKQFVGSIAVNSKLWNELNVASTLKKYLWPMNHVKPSSWMCSYCWDELNQFNKFYTRIKEVHKTFGVLNKSEEDNETLPAAENKIFLDDEILHIQASRFEETICDELSENLENEFKDILNKDQINRDILENELMLEEPKPSSIENASDKKSNSSSFVQKRKRGRPRKSISAVDKVMKSNKNKTKSVKIPKKPKTKQIKKEYCKYADDPSESKPKIENGEQSANDGSDIEQIELDHKSYESENDCNIDNDKNSENKSTNEICFPKTHQNEKDKFLKENFKITCFLCNISFETFFNMRKHFDEHHTERGHVKCCNKKFYRRSILVDHIHFHLNPNYFKCDKCGKVMADRRCLELHAEIHGGSQEKKHCCDICGKGFAKIGVLKKHRMIHLSEEEKTFSCSDCGKNFASNYLLSSHYRSVHLKKYAKVCDICGKSIRCKDVFERHMLQHEGKNAPSVNCDVCGLVLTDKRALKRHKDVIHPIGGQHEYTCSICSKTSPNLRAHKRHVQYKHVMGYDHKCTICDKAFKRAPTLKEHMASHTGTVLYTCPWCPKTFNSNANMHNHRKKIHPKEWEEASRKRYSGNLPPNFKPPTSNEHTDFNVSIDI